jgi:hypothetical protein
MDVKLSDLERFQERRSRVASKDDQTDRWYSVRDLWKRERIGVVRFEGKIEPRLDVHGAILFKYTRIGTACPSFLATRS